MHEHRVILAQALRRFAAVWPETGNKQGVQLRAQTLRAGNTVINRSFSSFIQELQIPRVRKCTVTLGAI